MLYPKQNFLFIHIFRFLYFNDVKYILKQYKCKTYFYNYCKDLGVMYSFSDK